MTVLLPTLVTLTLIFVFPVETEPLPVFLLASFSPVFASRVRLFSMSAELFRDISVSLLSEVLASLFESAPVVLLLDPMYPPE